MTAPSGTSPSWNAGFVALTALYLLSFPYHPGLRSPNELCRLWQARALVDHHTLSINETMRQYGPVGDLSCVAVVLVNGERQLARCVGEAPPGPVLEQWYYPSKAPLLSFVSAPIYAVLKAAQGGVSELAQVYFSRLFITVLPALGLIFGLRRFLREWVSPDIADLVALTYGLGTMAFTYAEMFLSHQLTAVLVAATFFSAWRTEHGRWPRWGWVVAGLAAGAAVTCEYTGALGVLCVASWVVMRRWGQWRPLGQAVGLVALGALPFAAALMAYHQACFGSPLTSGYIYLNDAAYQGWHVGGFLGIRFPDARAFGLSLFSPLRGLFSLSPFLLLTFAGLGPLRLQEKTLFAMTVLTLVANAYFTSSFTYDSWGWAAGPRHLTPMLPLLMVPVALGVERLRARGALSFSVAAGLCVSSVVTSGLVGFINYVPDDVSTSVWALAIPLMRDGYWPASVLAVAVANPASGFVLVALLATCA
ncbi:MAG: hypothetical protein JNG84_08835, partial [Archangium sp.]|nr:hypothetical protein [Archangium sp.]